MSFGYIALSAIRLAGGVTRTAPAPSRFMRLQVVDGTGGKRSEFTRLAGLLPTLSDSILDITVTDRVHFVTRPVDRSLIVSRDSDMESARMLASKLGIDPENVEYVPLEVNSLQATATLVVGRDMISSEGLFSQIKGKSPQD